MSEIKKLDSNYIIGTYNRFDEVLVSGKGATATTEEQRTLIDFGSGVGVNALGYSNENWINAICSQARAIQHTSNLYYNTPCVTLAKKLCDATNMKKMFFSNSGAEAVETCIKVARKYSFDRYGSGRNIIVTLNHSFHGRTISALTATGQESYHNWFFPFDSGFKYIDASINDLKKIDGSVCAIMMELIQGEGGLIVLDKEFVHQVAKLCKDRDILLIIDEVQTGIGRTGKLLCSENFCVKPDIIALAKGLGGGLPIGACLVGEKCQNVLEKGQHGATFGGNPVVCAGAHVVLDSILADGALTEINKKADYIRDKLSGVKEVEEVVGIGLMIGIALKTKEAHAVACECLEEGVMVLTAKTKIRLLPPLNISYSELDKGLEILIKVLNKA